MIISVYPEPFDFKEAIEQNPVVGVITIKIRDDAWEKIYASVTDINVLKEKIDKLFSDAVERTRSECSLNSENYKAVLLLSYDCEDAIIILFTNSFQFCKLLTTKLRTFELRDMLPNSRTRKIKHIITSTNTILGINLINKNKRLIIRIPLKHSNEYDKLYWFSLFEILPGHLQHAKNMVSKIAKKAKLAININPIIGRNDLFVHPKRMSGESLHTFLDTHYEFISKISMFKNTSVKSSETYISFPELDQVESKDKPNKLNKINSTVSNSLNKLIDEIEKNENISTLEKESFIQIVRKLTYLLEDKYLTGSFITLYPIISRAIRKYIKPRDKQGTPILDILTAFIELCYATRYQGSPPIGETAVYPTLGYYSLGQKVLILLDYLGNWIITNFAKQLPYEKFYPRYVAAINMNCPAGVTVPIPELDISFIFLPPRPIFHPEILLVVFFHELGHVIYDSFFRKISYSISDNDKELLRKLRNNWLDEFAEFFSAKMLANLNFDEYEKNIMPLCIEAFGFESKAKIDFEDIKKGHLNGARFLQEQLDSGNINHKRVIKRISEYLEIPSEIITKHFIKSLRFIADWNGGEVISKVRTFLSSDKKQKDFWNLWLLLNSLVGKEDFYYILSEED